MINVNLVNVVEVTYSDDVDKNKVPKFPLTALVHVPEESLPEMSADDKKFGGRMVDVYFKKAAEILAAEIGPIFIYQNGFRFLGEVKVLY